MASAVVETAARLLVILSRRVDPEWKVRVMTGGGGLDDMPDIGLHRRL